MFLKGLDDVSPNGPAMDFIWPVHQPLRADVSVPRCQRRILTVAKRAVKLDRRINYLVDHVREKHLGDRVLLPKIHAALGLVGDVEEHETRHVELAGGHCQSNVAGTACRC